ncbi:MAG: Uncharacterised protein [Prochlorococcus marinus str. MIT 9215]|nr:MAG: Uncharacterised protein [Prochlorococcus marinus str. MIT 9215]
MSKYNSYKSINSGWMNEIPSHWQALPCRGIVQEKTDKNHLIGSENYLSLMANVGVIPYEEKGDIGNKKPEDLSKCKIVHVGDFVINSMNYGIGSYGVSPYEGVCSPVYIVLEPRKSNIDERFAFRIFQDKHFQGKVQSLGNGILAHRCSIGWDDLKNIKVPIPPISEQKHIANFLDHETTKIDALITEQERLIELLQEKRQAVISHAVTKGLNPNAPMKDSGVEWLGKVPEHWEVGPIKRFLSSMNYKRVPLSSEERSSRQGNYPYYGASGIIDSVDDFLFNESLVLVSEDGANLLMRSTPIAFEAHGEYWVNNHAHILRPNDGLTLFWSERIESVQIAPFVTGSAQPKLTAEALLNLAISCPLDLEEKKAIEERIQTARSELEPLIEAAENAVKLLRERRSALISAAVTGQIDVRGLIQEEEAA